MKTDFKFSHEYNKLKDDEYTTIRGKTAFNQYFTGRTYSVIVRGKFSHHVILEEMYIAKIKNIPIELLRKDTAPIYVNNRRDFINLINRFRRFNKLENVNDEVTIFHLRKI